MAKEYIEREALLKHMEERLAALRQEYGAFDYYVDGFEEGCVAVEDAPAADVVEVVHDYREGDVCIYGFGSENKSRALVEIVRVLNDERGVAEVKFHKVFVDDTGNGLFNYLLESVNTMNASFQYLKNITPRMDGDSDGKEQMEGERRDSE